MRFLEDDQEEKITF